MMRTRRWHWRRAIRCGDLWFPPRRIDFDLYQSAIHFSQRPYVAYALPHPPPGGDRLGGVPAVPIVAVAPRFGSAVSAIEALGGIDLRRCDVGHDALHRHNPLLTFALRTRSALRSRALTLRLDPHRDTRPPLGPGMMKVLCPASHPAASLWGRGACRDRANKTPICNNAHARQMAGDCNGHISRDRRGHECHRTGAAREGRATRYSGR